MNWKQFLKPNRKKIVIVIFITLWLFWSYLNGGESYTGPTFLIHFLLIGVYQLAIFVFPWMILVYKTGLTTDIPMWARFIIIILGSFIYSYILSCLIVWVYDNIKKKILIRRTYEQKKIIKPEKQRNISFKINLDRNQKLYLSFLGMGIGGTLWAITSDQIELSVGIFLIFLDIIFMVFLILLSPVQNWIRRKFS